MSSMVFPDPSRPMPSPPSPPKEREVEIRDLTDVIKRRKAIPIVAAAVGVLLGVALVLLSAPMYTASARVEVTAPPGHVAPSEVQFSTVGDVSNLELMTTELKTQVAEILQDSVAIEAMKDTDLFSRKPYAIPSDIKPDDPMYAEKGKPLDQAPMARARALTIFEARTKADVVKGTRLIEVTFKDGDPHVAARVADAIVSAYRNESATRKQAQIVALNGTLNNQLLDLQKEVDRNQLKVEQYVEQNPGALAGYSTTAISSSGTPTSGTPTTTIENTRLETINAALTQASVARIAKEQIYKLTQRLDPQSDLSISASPLITGAAQDSALSNTNHGLDALRELISKRNQLLLQVSDSESLLGENSPEIKRFRQQQATISAQIHTELISIRDQAKKDLDLASETEAALGKSVQGQQGAVAENSAKLDMLVLLESRAAASRNLYQEIYARQQESQFASIIQATGINKISLAAVPIGASSPKPVLDIGGGLILGLTLGFVAIFAVELYDDSIHESRQIEENLHAKVLAEVPRTPKGSDPMTAWVINEPLSLSAGSYRRLRTELLPDGGDTLRIRSILVSSALSSDGKEATALNIASSFAAIGRKVLLIEADFAAESSSSLSSGSSTGLSDCLSGEASLAVAVHSAKNIPGVALLARGKLIPEAADLLASAAFIQVMAEAWKAFDCIIVCGPPVMASADAVSMVAQMDSFLLVARVGFTPLGALEDSAESLTGKGATFLGVVLNGVRPAKKRGRART